MKKSLLAAIVWATGIAATQAQVTQISANTDMEFIGLSSPTKAIFNSSVDNHLYASDGTAAGTILLSATITYQNTCGMVGNKILFRGTRAATGSELYITDGTAAGTTLVKDIYTGTTGSQIGNDVALFNGFVYFTAVTAAEGREVWKSDGTSAGTTLLKDIVAGTGNSNTADNYNLFSNGSYLLFSAQTGSSGYELWKSDGSTTGTTLLADINPGAASSNTDAFFRLGNLVLFQATTTANGKELWKTDGTTAGTVLVKDINSGTTGSTSMFGSFFFEFNNKAFFEANDGVNGDEVWYTDGTATGTALLKDVETGSGSSLSYLFNAVKVGNKFIFASANLFSTPVRAQLWQSDGTPAGTTLLKDFSAGGQVPLVLPGYDVVGNTYVPQLFQGSKFFFTAATPAEGLELWVSDGTIAGTTLVKDIHVGIPDGIDNISYQYASDALYFAADNGTNGTELWKTNGTASGTTLVADIFVGAGESEPLLWPIFNKKLTLTAKNADNAIPSLYVLNGNVSPLPVKLGDFTVLAQGNDGLLRWNTLQELNTSEFVVQRSLDGIHFQTIGSVRAKGQSNSHQAYTYTDAGITQFGKDIIYYRLQVLDKDNKADFTRIISLPLSGSQWSIKLANNPIQSTLQAIVKGATAITTFRVTDITGKSYTTAAFSGNGILTIPVQDLPAGVYFLTAENGKGRQTEKFVKN